MRDRKREDIGFTSSKLEMRMSELKSINARSTAIALRIFGQG
jgi:hypothetical protein